jgi:DNA-binding transcriptional LysR family regulator
MEAYGMELRQLRHFVALAEERSVTAAAHRELIVQSGLSNSIQALERELGSELYLRGTRPIRLTATGEALLNPARDVLNAAAAAERIVHDTKQVLVGRMRLGIPVSASHVVPLARHLGDFLRTYPGVDVSMRVAPATEIPAMVEHGELDCAVLPVAEQRGRLRLTPLGSEPMHLTCRPDHWLAKRDSVTLSELTGERFVEVLPGWLTRVLTDEAFAKAGITRRVVAEVGDWQLFLELVEAGVGIGFAPAHIPAALHRLTVDGLAMERRIYLIMPPAAETTPVAAAFAEAVTSVVTVK